MLLTHLNQSNSILLRQTDELFLKRILLNGVISGQTHEFKSKKSHEFESCNISRIYQKQIQLVYFYF
jgi:catabolite regulation protein CreA